MLMATVATVIVVLFVVVMLIVDRYEDPIERAFMRGDHVLLNQLLREKDRKEGKERPDWYYQPMLPNGLAAHRKPAPNYFGNNIPKDWK
jgi:hypothetical protein